VGFTDLFDSHLGSEVGWQGETTTTTAKQMSVTFRLSQRGRMLIFGAEGLVSVLCSHLFQDITAPEPSQSQIIYPCEGLIKQDSTIIPILQVVEGGRERVSKIPSL